MTKPKRGLGRGLESLFSDNFTTDIVVSSLPTCELEPNEGQPRTLFEPQKLEELAQSIKTHGVLQPLIVRPLPNGRYQIVAGERRWRAARMAQLPEVPVVVRELDDVQALEVALVENLSRTDLNPIEEANGYKILGERFNMTQEQIARRVGRSRAAVANSMRLLSLPAHVTSLLENGTITAGHARAFLTLDPGPMREAVKKTVDEGLSVRQAEQLAKRLSSVKKDEHGSEKIKQPGFYREVELALGEALSRSVKVRHKGLGRGELTVEFYSDDELAELSRKLAESPAKAYKNPD